MINHQIGLKWLITINCTNSIMGMVGSEKSRTMKILEMVCNKRSSLWSAKWRSKFERQGGFQNVNWNVSWPVPGYKSWRWESPWILNWKTLEIHKTDIPGKEPVSVYWFDNWVSNRNTFKFDEIEYNNYFPGINHFVFGVIYGAKCTWNACW